MPFSGAVPLMLLLAGAPVSPADTKPVSSRTKTVTHTQEVSCAFPRPPTSEQQKLPFNAEPFGKLELDLNRQTAETDDGTFVLGSLSLLPLANAPAVKKVRPEDRSTILAAGISEMMNSLAEGLVKSLHGKVTDRKQIQVGSAKGISLAGPILDEANEKSGASFLAHVVVSDTLSIYAVLAVTRDDKSGQEKAASFVKSLAFSPVKTTTKSETK